MEHTQPLSSEADRFMKIGRLFDAAGFGDEGRPFELVDFIEAASDAIPHHTSSADYQTYIRSALSQEHRELCLKGYRDDATASYMLGSVNWRIASSIAADMSAEEVRENLSRSVRSIVYSREQTGYGDEAMFRLAFANYAHQFEDDYERQTRRLMRRYCFYIDQQIIDVRHGVSKPLEFHPRTPAWRHVENGMASIAMLDGYRMQPPDHQREDDGAWRLPDRDTDV